MLAVEEAVLPAEAAAMKSRFLEQTGYSSRDIISANYTTGRFLTRNGGHYKLVGEKLLHIEGPSPDPEDRL